jgi:hypothetical protein
MKKRSIHRYTPEQNAWLKNVILPSKQEEFQPIADQFNQKFGTNLCASALFRQAQRAQSKKVSKKSPRKTRNKQHSYTPEQNLWLLAEYKDARGRPGKMKSLTYRFNRKFKTRIKVDPLSQKCRELYHKGSKTTEPKGLTIGSKSQAIRMTEPSHQSRFEVNVNGKVVLTTNQMPEVEKVTVKRLEGMSYSVRANGKTLVEGINTEPSVKIIEKTTKIHEI